jgi:xanthosine utilization system XapX-like protein
MFPKASVAIGMLAFTLVDTAKHEPPLVILLGGVLGVIVGALHLP